MIGCEEKNGTQFQHAGNGQHLPYEAMQASVGLTLAGGKQRAARLNLYQAQKHDVLAENVLDTGKVRKSARFDGEGHVHCNSDSIHFVAGAEPLALRNGSRTWSTRSRVRSSVRLRARACSKSSSDIIPTILRCSLLSTTGIRV